VVRCIFRVLGVGVVARVCCLVAWVGEVVVLRACLWICRSVLSVGVLEHYNYLESLVGTIPLRQIYWALLGSGRSTCSGKKVVAATVSILCTDRFDVAYLRVR
jgi:hypothetical protein